MTRWLLAFCLAGLLPGSARANESPTSSPIPALTQTELSVLRDFEDPIRPSALMATVDYGGPDYSAGVLEADIGLSEAWLLALNARTIYLGPGYVSEEAQVGLDYTVPESWSTRFSIVYKTGPDDLYAAGANTGVSFWLNRRGAVDSVLLLDLGFEYFDIPLTHSTTGNVVSESIDQYWPSLGFQQGLTHNCLLGFAYYYYFYGNHPRALAAAIDLGRFDFDGAAQTLYGLSIDSIDIYLHWTPGRWSIRPSFTYNRIAAIDGRIPALNLGVSYRPLDSLSLGLHGSKLFISDLPPSGIPTDYDVGADLEWDW